MARLRLGGRARLFAASGVLLTLWYIHQVRLYISSAAAAAAAQPGASGPRQQHAAAIASPPPQPPPPTLALEPDVLRDDDFADAAEMATLLAAEQSSVSVAARRRAVAGMAVHAWDGYARYAFGKDELQPTSRGARDWLQLGLTAVDALDTLMVLRLRSRADAARAFVATRLDITPDVDVNLFETTIRVLGGILAAAALPGGDPDGALVRKAAVLGEALSAAFGTPSGVPFSDVNLRARTAHGPAWTSDSSLSEATSLLLEYAQLASVLHKPALAAPAARAQRLVYELARASYGLAASKFISTQSVAWGGGRVFTLGSRVDSYYEYLLKAWLQGGRRDAALLRAYQDGVHGVTTRLLRRSRTERLLFVAELFDNGGGAQPHTSGQFDHLVCFYPGLLALGHAAGVRPAADHAAAQDAALQALGFPPGATQLDVAAELTASCHEMYARNPLGMGPEIAFFNLDDAAAATDVLIKPADAHSLLRPEYIEALFYMWRVTKEQKYRDWGWDAWRGVEAHARVASGGYASVESVLEARPRLRDGMESFFLAETVKYLYLLFCDDEVLPLDQWVFNTEAHPLPLPRGGEWTVAAR